MILAPTGQHLPFVACGKVGNRTRHRRTRSIRNGNVNQLTVNNGAVKLRAKAIDVAAALMQARPDALEIVDGKVLRKAQPAGPSISLGEIAEHLAPTSKTLGGRVVCSLLRGAGEAFGKGSKFRDANPECAQFPNDLLFAEGEDVRFPQP